jgi:hypothetical protein
VTQLTRIFDVCPLQCAPARNALPAFSEELIVANRVMLFWKARVDVRVSGTSFKVEWNHCNGVPREINPGAR